MADPSVSKQDREMWLRQHERWHDADMDPGIDGGASISVIREWTSRCARLIADLEQSTPARADIYAEIEKERDRQDSKWGAPRHDDGHSQYDWSWLINKHAQAYGIPEFRQQMIRVAALAVAAIESHDRQIKET